MVTTNGPTQSLESTRYLDMTLPMDGQLIRLVHPEFGEDRIEVIRLFYDKESFTHRVQTTEDEHNLPVGVVFPFNLHSSWFRGHINCDIMSTPVCCANTLVTNIYYAAEIGPIFGPVCPGLFRHQQDLEFVCVFHSADEAHRVDLDHPCEILFNRSPDDWWDLLAQQVFFQIHYAIWYREDDYSTHITFVDFPPSDDSSDTPSRVDFFKLVTDHVTGWDYNCTDTTDDEETDEVVDVLKKATFLTMSEYQDKVGLDMFRLQTIPW